MKYAILDTPDLVLPRLSGDDCIVPGQVTDGPIKVLMSVAFPGYGIYWYGPDNSLPAITFLTAADAATVDFSVAATAFFVIAASLNDAQFYDGSALTASADILIITVVEGRPVSAANTVSTDYTPSRTSSEILACTGSFGGGTYTGGPMDFTGTPFEGLGSVSITF